MKKNNLPVTGVISLCAALALWFGSSMINKSSFRLALWIYRDMHLLEDVVAALVVSVLYAVVTYAAVVLLAAAVTRLIYKKSLFACMQHQMHRYFAFWGLLPLTITNMCWDIMWPFLPAKYSVYRLPLPRIEVALHLSDALCETVLILTVALMVLSTVSFAYGVFVNFNIHFNRVCTVLWIVYAYLLAYVLPPYFEYGGWFLLFTALTYCVGIALFVLCERTQKQSLIPKYKITVLPFDEADDSK